MTFKSEKPAGHILAAATITVWGTTFISSKILLTQFTPLQVMILRFTIAYITLTILGRRKVKTTWREEFTFFLLALTGTTFYFLFENKALTHTFASNVSIILSAAPILTAVLAHFFTKDEKISGRVIFGSLLAFAGTALVVFNGTVVLHLNPMGDILSLGAALCWASYSVILKKQVNSYDPVYLTRKVLLYSILTTLPLLFAEGGNFPLREAVRPVYLCHLLFLGVLGSGICYVAWNMAAKKLGIVMTNNYIYLNPFITMAAAGLILHEAVTFMGVLGAAFIISGVAAAGSKKNAAGIRDILRRISGKPQGLRTGKMDRRNGIDTELHKSAIEEENSA